MENVTDIKYSISKNELRKRLNGNLINDLSKKSFYGMKQPFLESYSKQQFGKIISHDAKENTNAKHTNMTMSILSDFTNIASRTKTKTTKVHQNKTSPIIAKKMIKRSLSESSAEEYHRSKEDATACRSMRKMWQNRLIISPENKTVQPKKPQRPIDDVVKLKKHIKRNQYISDMIDVAIRVVVVLIFIKLETTTAFQRNIHIEELWLYKNPRTVDFVSPKALVLSVIICPFVVSLLNLYITGDWRDFRAANWVWTLALCVNGAATSLLKITAGRPRPDFFYRCFPDGVLLANVTPTAVNFNCTGKWRDINEGYKSFPSGHSSFAFAAFGFIALYWSGKLHTFNTVGRGESWRLFISIFPWFVSALVAVSRTCDYHHHWQDVSVGALIGILTAYVTYRQYYPSIFTPNSHIPLPRDGYNIDLIKNFDFFNEPIHPNGNQLKKSNLNRKIDEPLVSEDQIPLICDEDVE